MPSGAGEQKTSFSSRPHGRQFEADKESIIATTTSIYTRKNRSGENLTIGLCAELDIANDGEPEFKYATVCDDHGAHVLSKTRLLAYNTRGTDFCGDCRTRAAASKKTAEPTPKQTAPARKAAPAKTAVTR